MRVVLCETYGSLVLREREKPKPAEGEVLVRVHASSLNAVDWYGYSGRPLIARLLMGFRKPKSNAAGTDFAGIVEAVGDGVTSLSPGDEVYGCESGSFAEYITVSTPVGRKPTNLSLEEAAAVPLAAFTALQGLRDHGGLQEGQRILVNGASGGVGLFAVQIAKALGAEVHAVCNAHNVEQAHTLGADRVFDYTQDDFTRSGEHYDVLFDNAGNRSWFAIRRVLAPTGVIVLVGGRRTPLLGPLAHTARITLATKLARRRSSFFIAKPNDTDLATLTRLIETGQIKPIIERRFELAQINQAMHTMDGHARSKIIVTV